MKPVTSIRLSPEARAIIEEIRGTATQSAVIEAGLALLSKARRQGLSWADTAAATRARVEDIPAALRASAAVSFSDEQNKWRRADPETRAIMEESWKSTRAQDDR